MFSAVKEGVKSNKKRWARNQRANWQRISEWLDRQVVCVKPLRNYWKPGQIGWSNQKGSWVETSEHGFDERHLAKDCTNCADKKAVKYDS